MPLTQIGIHIPVLSHFRIHAYTREPRAQPGKRRAALPPGSRLPTAARDHHKAQAPYGSRLSTAAPSLSSASLRTARGHAAFMR